MIFKLENIKMYAFGFQGLCRPVNVIANFLCKYYKVIILYSKWNIHLKFFTYENKIQSFFTAEINEIF